jgi:O-antigen/teichoic acid export membrane protein
MMNDNKKIAVNSVIIFIRLVFTSLIGILMSRYVLDALGASDYGLYNVVGGIVTLLNVFNTAMLSTTYRFIAAELGKGDNGSLNKVFNTSFLIHAGFALFILVVGFAVGEWYIDNYLNVAEGKISDAHFVFRISLITTALSTLLVPYQGLITAYEKFNVLAIRDIITKILLFAAVLLLLYKDTNRIRVYAWIQLGYNLIYNGSFYIYCKHKYKEVSSFKLYKEWKLVKEMASFALWTLFGAVASIGRNQGCVLLINFFFGSIVNAAYALAAQIEGFVQTFARSLNSAAVPQITKSFSGGNKDRSITLTSYISKYTFILMAMVAFPVLLEMDFLLGIWLKEVPEGAASFCRLLLLGGLLGTLGEGIPALVNATGNIKTYQIFFHTFTLLGLPIAWLFLHWGYNQYTILIVYCGIYFLSTFLRLFLLKYLYHFDISQIIKVSYTRIILISIPLVVCYVFYDSSHFSTMGHILGLVGAELVLCLVVILLGLDNKERLMIKSFVNNKIRHTQV